MTSVAGGANHHRAITERLEGTDHLHDRVEHPQVGAVRLECARCGHVGRRARGYLRLDEVREVELDRYRHHARALLDRPLNPPEHRVGVASAVVAKNLADEGLPHATGNADPRSADITAQNGAGAMGAVSLPVTVARAGEVLLD